MLDEVTSNWCMVYTYEAWDVEMTAGVEFEYKCKYLYLDALPLHFCLVIGSFILHMASLGCLQHNPKAENSPSYWTTSSVGI